MVTHAYKNVYAMRLGAGGVGLLQHPLEKIRGCAAPPAKLLLTIYRYCIVLLWVVYPTMHWRIQAGAFLARAPPF